MLALRMEVDRRLRVLIAVIPLNRLDQYHQGGDTYGGSYSLSYCSSKRGYNVLGSNERDLRYRQDSAVSESWRRRLENMLDRLTVETR